MPLLREPRQRILHDALVPAIAQGRGAAVADATWPGPLLSRAERDLAVARAEGRVADDALVLFTSGSTGRPRGVHRTCGSWRAAHADFAAAIGLTSADVVSVPGPLWSGIFLWGAWNAYEAGARAVLAGEDDAAATLLFTVAARMGEVLGRRAAGGLPALRTVVLGGDRVPPGLRARCAAAGLRLIDYYGAAELSLVALRDADGPYQVFSGVEVAARAGEVWVRTPFAANGYLDPADPGPLRRDGAWVTVGDLGTVSPAGLTVHGRGGAAVTIGAHTVVVEDVEHALRAVPGVADAAVLGLPHRRLGQSLAALVVTDLPEAVLRDAVAGLPRPARPRRWLRVARVPRSPQGKIDRRAVAALGAALADGAGVPMRRGTEVPGGVPAVSGAGAIVTGQGSGR